MNQEERTKLLNELNEIHKEQHDLREIIIRTIQTKNHDITQLKELINYIKNMEMR